MQLRLGQKVHNLYPFTTGRNCYNCAMFEILGPMDCSNQGYLVKLSTKRGKTE